MTTQDAGQREAALAELSAVLEEWTAKHGLGSAFAGALHRVAANGFHLADRADPWLAHLLHASLRSAVSDDSALDQEQLVLSAPDLRIGDPDGVLADAPRHRLATEPAAEAATEPTAARLEALRELLRGRRSVPYYSPDPVPGEALAALLGTALGARGLLTAYHRRDVPSRMFPSAGGLQPVDTYVIVNRVDGLERGVYFYDPVRHELARQERGDFRQRVVEATVATGWLFHAPVVLALVADFPRVSWKYGTRGYRFLHVDTGVAVQNLYLVAQALGLCGNAVAAFDDDAFNHLLRLDGVDRFTNLLFAAGAPAARTMR